VAVVFSSKGNTGDGLSRYRLYLYRRPSPDWLTGSAFGGVRAKMPNFFPDCLENCLHLRYARRESKKNPVLTNAGLNLPLLARRIVNIELMIPSEREPELNAPRQDLVTWLSHCWQVQI